MKMLEYTFQHLSGFGLTKERELWKRRIYTWSDYEAFQSRQLHFDFDDALSMLTESRRKLEASDVDYFAKRLPPNLHFLIPHSFPEETVFIDIETTGLSIYYDTVTIVGWSKLNGYSVLVQGDAQSEQEFRKCVEEAKCVVTFNGAMFDLPFIRKFFPGIKIPECHIDLRFFGKRAGYRGGQKKIEKELQMLRPAEITDIDGQQATLLWFQYKEGDVDALKKLITYNSYDIDGMKWLFEKLTEEIIKKEEFPIFPTNIFKFSKYCTYAGPITDDTASKMRISPYSGYTGPVVTFDSLKNVSAEKIVGIDLTGSEKRPTGWCLMENGQANTKLISMDEDIIAETIKCNPAIISIDSPLSIPEGRTSFFDDDPMREQFGITRFCERMMAKRGIKSYPCLIPSMQKLTQRGMMLAERLRNLGFTVIESYPGAAQDIMGIPRKGKSLEYLIKGLRQFGIHGDYNKPGVSHDEIDAITSAIVGYFYLANQYEGLGNEAEGYLIVPKIESHHPNHLN
jgi:uncharacterized protein YprB with RNaseH-like and TPR domain/predicted nuclease with RNAse H fold